ncbi:C4-dicarboxylate transporter [Paractinoplanes atraurantiacus]|uniref:Tellurite resistance protein n=1 Tax=Paractinoplanes atraurantiacus TaxID=1036182 RepID=A0A285I6D6_9ACTN|nr:C4-dicarboxylate transporter [Actinoplanes atraurantiacus]SNY42636.1 tellurite resistance protein [Actinoplanes atraurantiacus]
MPLNLFGIAFGLAGLAGTWTASSAAGLVPGFVGDALWWAVLVVWLTLLGRYLVKASPADLRHPVLGPFAALVPTTGLLMGGRLAGTWLTGGRVVIAVMLVLATVFAGWFVAHLLSGGLDVDTLHAGYLLPTVAASLVGAQSAALAGWHAVAVGAFGVGILFWFLIGALLLGRLALRPALPGPLLPTMAIFSAPPAVAGNAWYAINGGTLDTIDLLLLGTMVPLLLVQLFLTPNYLRQPFAHGFWALTFTIAASGTYTIHWLTGEHATAWRPLSWLVLTVVTVLIGLIAVKSSLLALRKQSQHRAAVPV